jgi:hypothetical protein
LQIVGQSTIRLPSDMTVRAHVADARPDAHTMWFGINGVLAIVVSKRLPTAHASEPAYGEEIVEIVSNGKFTAAAAYIPALFVPSWLSRPQQARLQNPKEDTTVSGGDRTGTIGGYLPNKQAKAPR